MSAIDVPIVEIHCAQFVKVLAAVSVVRKWGDEHKLRDAFSRHRGSTDTRLSSMFLPDSAFTKGIER